ncbi:MAG: tetratricopeptide repeat protein, partial [Anaerolineales bacterium]|nr:tetratricopeptide repeat protein [Anaerolineales bacterium]
LERARQLVEKSYRYYTEEDNARGIIGATNLLGQLHRKLGNVEQAYHWFETAISLARQSRDYYTLLVPLNNFGLLLHELGEYQKSLRVFGECEQVVEQIKLGQDGLVMMNFGRNYEALGEIDKATAAYLGAMPIFKSQHEQHFYLVAHTYASRAVRLQGDLSQARKLAQTALEGFRTTNIRFSIGNTLANLADIELADGHLSKAHKLYEEAQTIMHDLDKGDGQLRMVLGLAHLALLEHQNGRARTRLEQALSLTERTHNVMYQYHLLALLALYTIQQNQLERGAALLHWLQQQPRAFWETRQFAQQIAAAFLTPTVAFKAIPLERPLAELLTLA